MVTARTETNVIERYKGWVMSAYIEDKGDKNALAEVQNQQVLVTNGAHTEGNICLVRLNLKPKHSSFHNKPVVNFVCSTNDDRAIPRDQYVLLAQWEERMHGNSHIPQLHEVHRYFNPGDMRGYYYIYKKDPREKTLIYQVKDNQIRKKMVKPSELIPGQLHDPNKSARVILTNSQQQLEDLIAQIERHCFQAIVMQPTK